MRVPTENCTLCMRMETYCTLCYIRDVLVDQHTYYVHMYIVFSQLLAWKYCVLLCFCIDPITSPLLGGGLINVCGILVTVP